MLSFTYTCHQRQEALTTSSLTQPNLIRPPLPSLPPLRPALHFRSSSFPFLFLPCFPSLPCPFLPFPSVRTRIPSLLHCGVRGSESGPERPSPLTLGAPSPAQPSPVVPSVLQPLRLATPPSPALSRHAPLPECRNPQRTAAAARGGGAGSVARGEARGGAGRGPGPARHGMGLWGGAGRCGAEGR